MQATKVNQTPGAGQGETAKFELNTALPIEELLRHLNGEQGMPCDANEPEKVEWPAGLTPGLYMLEVSLKQILSYPVKAEEQGQAPEPDPDPFGELPN